MSLLSVTLLVVVDPMLQRTMAGFADKDPLSLVFIFASFYFYIIAWQSKVTWRRLAFAFLSGMAMMLLSLTWEGVGIFITIVVLFNLIRLCMDDYQELDFYAYLCWLMPLLAGLFGLTAAYRNLSNAFALLAVGPPTVFFVIAAVYWLVTKKTELSARLSLAHRLPIGVVISGAVAAILLLATLFGLGPSAVMRKITHLKGHFLHPVGHNRLMSGLGELKLPFLSHWWDWYRLLFIPLLVGILWLARKVAESLRINRWIFAFSIFVVLLGAILSQFSPRSIFNGDSDSAFALYVGSLLISTGVVIGLILAKRWKSREPAEKIHNEGLFALLWFFLTLFLARGGLRFAFFLSPAIVIIGSVGVMEASKKIVPKPYQAPLAVCLIASVLCWEILVQQKS